MQGMDLSIIILNYNAGYFLDLCLHSVKKAMHDIKAELFIVDNNSNDHSFTRNKVQFPEFNFLQNKANLCFAKGNKWT